MKKIEFYRRHITIGDRYNVYAIKIQTIIRKRQAMRRVWRIKYITRKKSNLKYLHFHYAISQYVKDAMAMGVEKIFDKAKEKIVERKREKRNKEKSYAPAMVNEIIEVSTQKAYESLIAFYEREDYRYRLGVMEQVAARLQSNWRGRRERARMFEENRKHWFGTTDIMRMGKYHFSETGWFGIYVWSWKLLWGILEAPKYKFNANKHSKAQCHGV